MKSNLFNKLFGIIIIVLSFLLVTNVSAEECTGDDCDTGDGQQNTSVLVGTVTSPVYEMEISWGDMIFNWDYNSETDEFYWSAANSNFISIKDKSIYGKVQPSVEWNPEDNYKWATGIFKYELNHTAACSAISEETFDSFISKGQYLSLYTDSVCETSVTEVDSPIYEEGKYFFSFPGTFSLLETNDIPESGRIKNVEDGYDYYAVYFELGIDKSLEFVEPKEGELIGTITVKIDTNNNN